MILRLAGGFALAVWVSIFARSTFACQGDRVIELEIKVDASESEDHQVWSEILADVGADRVRLTSSAASQPGVNESEFRGQKILVVSGLLSRNGQLILPGGKFSKRDAAKIRELIRQLRADGAEITLAPKLSFDLTADQLVGLSKKLAADVRFETKGVPIGDVVQRIESELGCKLTVGPEVEAALAGPEAVAEEMKGLSLGTVLSAAIRPLGLVVVPTRAAGESLKLSLVDSRTADEHWPIGWPSEQTPGKTAPKLFERFNFELNRAPLSEALDAIQKKVGVPILMDHNGLAREGVELDKIRVTFNKQKQTYYGAIEEIVSQARPKLKLELRVDDGLRPFLWISAARSPRADGP
jgi:hypothetical protein